MPPSLTVVSAFVDPIVQLVRASLGKQARPVGIALVGELDPPPAIAVTIAADGELHGVITWMFSRELVRDYAVRLLSVPAAALDDATCDLAAAELANVVVGNATAALLDAGYRVDITPPTVHGPDADRRLANRALVVTLQTDHGVLRVALGVEERRDA